MAKSNINIQDDSVGLVVVVTGIFFAFLVCSVVYFVVLYRNRQLRNKKEQEELHAAFHQELLKTQLEVQEQTLNYISTEIHDNITQVLSFVKLTLANIASSSEGEKKSKINESRELVAQTITDLRDLSKSLSFEHIAQIGLVKTIGQEVERINKSGLTKISLLTEGQIYPLGEQRELVLFRIYQEAINNALKYADAKHFKI